MVGRSPMDAVWGWIVFLLLAPILIPALIVLTAQVLLAFLIQLLPWLIALVLVMGLAAGLSAGVTLRRQLPRSPHSALPPAGVDPIRRPRAMTGKNTEGGHARNTR